MSGTAYKCGKCDGHGVLLINISSDGEETLTSKSPAPTAMGQVMYQRHS